jgi:hypothetical protein
MMHQRKPMEQNMMEDWPKLAADFERLLRLKSIPFGMKLFERPKAYTRSTRSLRKPRGSVGRSGSPPKTLSVRNAVRSSAWASPKTMNGAPAGI